MSGSTANSNESSAREDKSSAPSDNWREKAIRNQIYLRQGHEGAMLERVQRVQRISEDLAKSLQRSAGEEFSSEDAGQEEDMGVSIGNEVTEVHYHMPPQPTAPPQRHHSSPISPLPTTQSGITRREIAAWVLAAALGGGAAANWWLGNSQDTTNNVVPGFGKPRMVEERNGP